MSSTNETLKTVAVAASNGQTDARAFFNALDEDDKAKFAKMLFRQLDPTITHDPNSKGIVLPGDPIPMDCALASEVLAAHARAQQEMCEVIEHFDAYPYDAAVNFVRAMKQIYHLADVKSYDVQTFFGPVKVKPEWRTVKLSHRPDDNVMVPVGAYNIPGIDGEVRTGFGRNPSGRYGFYVNAEVKTKDRQSILDLIALTKSLIISNSIYKAKALRLAVKPDGQIIEDKEPTFIDVGGVKMSDLIFNEDVERLIKMSMVTPIVNLQRCVNAGINMSRKVLLTSKYGMGKSLTGRALAALGIEHGWTFVLVDNARGLRAALEFAKRFPPCMVFVEDIDRVTEDRGQDMTNDLLNTLDGVLSKNDQIMTIFTTNHAERITAAVRRAGRIDVVVNIDLPNAQTVERMIRSFAGHLLAQDTVLSEAVERMAGFTPATIAEVIKAAKLSAIMENRDVITGDDVRDAAIGMRHHHEFASGGETVHVTPAAHAGQQFTGIIETVEEHSAALQFLSKATKAIADSVGARLN